jgi:hypothetical protein
VGRGHTFAAPAVFDAGCARYFAALAPQGGGASQVEIQSTHSLKAPWLESAWFQPLNLWSDILISKFAFINALLAPLHPGGAGDPALVTWTDADPVASLVGLDSTTFHSRYFAFKTPVDDGQYGPCNQSSDTPRE